MSPSRHTHGHPDTTPGLGKSRQEYHGRIPMVAAIQLSKGPMENSLKGKKDLKRLWPEGPSDLRIEIHLFFGRAGPAIKQLIN